MHPGLLLSGYDFLFQPDLYVLLYISLTPAEWNYSRSPFSARALYFLSFVPLAPAVRNSSRHSYSTRPLRRLSRTTTSPVKPATNSLPEQCCCCPVTQLCPPLRPHGRRHARTPCSSLRRLSVPQSTQNFLKIHLSALCVGTEK